jgi:leucyl/phenylalanyl-tRNA--protein transferase
VSGALTPEILLQAYAVGLFPMAEARDDPTLYWIDPEVRGIIPLESFHVPRSLRRTLRRGRFAVRADTAFEAVMWGCAEAGPGRSKTWINDEILALYTTLHAMGRAHSVEAWQGGELAGGLYGVALGGAFFGESMFTRVTDASKVALVHLVAILSSGGFTLLDTQFLTGHLARFGATEISREAYRARLARALSVRAAFGATPGGQDIAALF